jgi:hypothetical protein
MNSQTERSVSVHRWRRCYQLQPMQAYANLCPQKKDPKILLIICDLVYSHSLNDNVPSSLMN